MTRFLVLAALATGAIVTATYVAFRCWEELAEKEADRRLAAARERLLVPDIGRPLRRQEWSEQYPLVLHPPELFLNPVQTDRMLRELGQ